MPKRLKSDQEFYEEKSWGSVSIEDGKDLPTLKLRRLLDALPNEGKVLEIGCGSGRILASVRRRRPKLELTGVDISSAQIRLARRDNKGIAFAIATGERLPFGNEQFDAVFFLDVLEHVDHPDILMREATRTLRRGGTFHFFCPAEGRGICRISRTLLGWHIKEKTAGHIQQFTYKELEDLTRWMDLAVTQRKYSYHLLGSVMDYVMFALLLNKRIARMFWSKNKYYRNARTEQTLPSRLMNSVLSFCNAIAYYEALWLGRVRLFGTGLHITARKK
jgi:ubiquinone/menaquinone biosynthesis C-methylase UbiE